MHFEHQLVIGYWLLVIGYWLLVIGYWLLVIGYWLFSQKKGPLSIKGIFLLIFKQKSLFY
jgi:hypothetical protein